jgi:hypothetical protein
MALRKSFILKFFALLLFTFELLAPVYLSSKVDSQLEESSDLQWHTSTPFTVFSSLFYEEAGNEEEREGKEHQKIFQYTAVLNFVSVFDCRLQKDSVSNTESFTTYVPASTSLNTLYSVFRI